jgi:glutaredoxin
MLQSCDWCKAEKYVLHSIQHSPTTSAYFILIKRNGHNAKQMIYILTERAY